MTAAVADVDQIDRRPCRAAAGRRFSHPDGRQPAPALRRHPGTSRPAPTRLRYTVTAPRPASDTLLIPGLRGATWTLVEGSTFRITRTSGDILPGEPAVPLHGQWLITVKMGQVRDGSRMTLHHTRGEPVDHARAVSGVLRGNADPGPAVDTPQGHGQPWGGL